MEYFAKVRGFINPKTMKPVPNQYIIETMDGIYFQSYTSTIVYKPLNGKIKLDFKFWDYSKTTSKYRNKFLNETKEETEAKIKSGEYELVILN